MKTPHGDSVTAGRFHVIRYNRHMKIGVISDTHDRLDGIDSAVKIFADSKVDMVVHCGDWVATFTFDYFVQKLAPLKVPIRAVLGNNDTELARRRAARATSGGNVELSPKSVFEFEADGRRIAVYHGQDPSVLSALIECKKYDAVFSGHTHTVRNERVHDVLVLNPGTTCFIQSLRILDEGSVAIYDSDTNTATIVTFDRQR